MRLGLLGLEVCRDCLMSIFCVCLRLWAVRVLDSGLKEGVFRTLWGVGFGVSGCSVKGVLGIPGILGTQSGPEP